MPTELFNTVNALVEEELELYKSLGELVNFEEEKVNESDMEGLLEVLQQKQSIISRQEVLLEKWNEISASLGIAEGREGPVFWNTLSQRIGESGYKQIVKRIDEVRELGQKLLDQESKIRQNLEENLAEMRQTLLKMGRNRVAMRGYSQGMASIY
ncbi:flagellar protein FlgN [Synergistaceae bacterium OttesenSCG-928-I11]|nr:flagellar protein FlgN [Synergistaceae bacterium OttesenSCG-928-I11]